MVHDPFVFFHANTKARKQPWSTYAVHQTTLLQWAFFWDCLLLYLYHTSTEMWSDETQMMGLVVLLSWMLTSKFIKLMGHYIRYPVDFFLLPISIIFGYLHGLIKAKAMLSLNVVSLRFIRCHFRAFPHRINPDTPGNA